MTLLNTGLFPIRGSGTAAKPEDSVKSVSGLESVCREAGASRPSATAWKAGSIRRGRLPGFSAVLLALGASPTFAASIMNGSFETGDFTGWVSTDISGPFEPQGVRQDGTTTALANILSPSLVLPSDGDFAATNGFDGSAGTISLAQDIGTIGPNDVLTFDFRAGWDLEQFSGADDSDRTFEVVIEPAGGGNPLLSSLLLVAEIGTATGGTPNSDTGPLSGQLDLSSLAGTDARVNFLWTIPDANTGPANAQLDNVSIVPEPSVTLLLGLGLFGLVGVRRR